MGGSFVSDNTTTGLNPTTARVQRHRAKLRAKHCRRLEVWIGRSVIEQVRAVAARKRLSVWEVVQEALEVYVTGYAVADKSPDTSNTNIALRGAERRERMTSLTAQAIRLYDTDPNISAYKAALVAGISPSALYRALAARERLLSEDGCRSRLVSPR